MQITVYSHFFTVTGHDRFQYQAIKEFAFRLADYDYRAVYKARAFGQKAPAPTLKKLYAAFTENRREWRFHIHSLKEFRDLLDGRGIKYDLEEAELYKFKPVKLNLMDGFVARENQEPLIDYLVDDGVTKVLNLQTGQGKATINSEVVLTPTGWKRIGDMQVGDKVICPDNKIVDVTGVYPQGIIPTYAFVFEGIDEPIVCSYDHLWAVSIKGVVKVVDSKTIYEHFHYQPEISIFIPRVDVKEDYSVENQRFVELVDVRLNKQEPCTCIAIDHPSHLYVTTNGVVTHNTFCALAAAVRIGGKILISIEARFFNLWSEAFAGKKKVLDVDPSTEVVYIQGSKDLKKALDMGMNGQLDDVKVFVCSSRTLINFIELYEKFNGELEGVYPCSPEQMYELFDIGSRIKDEVHLSLWANFKEELYMHTGKSISLSATLEDGTFLDKVLAVMFPKSIRSPEVEYLKYIDVYSLMYTLEKPDQVKTSHRGNTDYSHNAYEDYILKNKKMYYSYSRIIVEWLASEYLSIRKDKQRACIFVSSVEMATAIWNTLKKEYPNIHFERYAASAGDIYEDAKQADVLVTTVQSFGTGFDLEDLICSLMTTNLRSQKTNLQVLGRLRVLKNYPDQTPKFYYLICSDIRKHIAYHEEKKLQFNGKVKSHQNRFLRITV